MDGKLSRAGRPGRRSLAETATLDAGLAQQLAVLLLGHALAALLDHRAHTTALPNVADNGSERTDPIRLLARSAGLGSRSRVAVARHEGQSGLRRLLERSPQVVVDCVLRDAEGPSDPHGGEFTGV